MSKYIQKIIYIVFCILLTGCSGADAPFNPEPSIAVSGVTDISRTEATVTLSISNGSQSQLQYVTLCYGVCDKESDMQVIDCATDKVALSIKLENLSPGTTYTCYESVAHRPLKFSQTPRISLQCQTTGHLLHL